MWSRSIFDYFDVIITKDFQTGNLISNGILEGEPLWSKKWLKCIAAHSKLLYRFWKYVWVKRACSQNKFNKSTLYVWRSAAFVKIKRALKLWSEWQIITKEMNQRREEEKKLLTKQFHFHSGLTRWRFIVYFDLFGKWMINKH